MKNIKIISTGRYLPQCKVDNNEIAEKLNVTENFIYKRTGIETRYYTTKTQEYMAKKLIQNIENFAEYIAITSDIPATIFTRPLIHDPPISFFLP